MRFIVWKLFQKSTPWFSKTDGINIYLPVLLQVFVCCSSNTFRAIKGVHHFRSLSKTENWSLKTWKKGISRMIFTHNVDGELIRYRIVFKKQKYTTSRVVSSKPPKKTPIANSKKRPLRRKNSLIRKQTAYVEPDLKFEEFVKALHWIVLRLIYRPVSHTNRSKVDSFLHQ